MSKVNISADTYNLQEIEKVVVIQCCESLNWNMTLAAVKLGIDRRTLYRKVHSYGVKPTRKPPEPKPDPEPAPAPPPPKTTAPGRLFTAFTSYGSRDEPGQGGSGVDGYW